MDMNDFNAFTSFMTGYKEQWDLNQTARENYDEDLEYYMSYRPAQRYPLIYNESFNKLLPRIFVVLSRFMDQIYQAGTGNIVSVRPRKRQDYDRAPRVEGLLNYQLEMLNEVDMQGGSYMFNFEWMFNAVAFGKGIAKMYWRKDERITARRVDIPFPVFDPQGRFVGIDSKHILVNDPQVVYEGPYAEVLHNKLFVPHPLYKNIQQMPFVFCVYQKSVDELKKKADAGIYKNISNLGWADRGMSDAGLDSYERIAKSLEIEGVPFIAGTMNERVSPTVDVIEGYGKYIFPEDEQPYEIGSGLKIKGRESEAIIHIGNYKTVLSIQKNNYGIRPFFDIGCYHHPEMFWDIGLIRLGKGIQEQYNTLINTRFQNAIMLVNQMLKVKVDSDIPPEALIWKPHGLVPVNEMDDVQPLIQPDVSQTQVFREQEDLFDSTLQEMTGVYAYNMGETPNRKEYVGTMHSLQAMGESRTKLLMMTMDHMGFRPLLKYMMMLNMYHLPSNYETRITTRQGDQFTPMFAGDIHVGYDFSARYTGMEPALGKHMKSQQLLQLAALWKDSPYLQHYQWMKSIMELMDMQNTDKYLKSPQQLQAEQQQAVQGQLREAMIQDKLTANEQGRKITGDLMKGLMK